MKKMNLIRTTSKNQNFQNLCNELDTDLNNRYGQKQSSYDNFNKIEENQTVLVGLINEQPAAIGCFKKMDKHTVEIKRMFVKKDFRRKGYSTNLLEGLENWAKELGFKAAMLETGKGQPEAISLYQKRGYVIIQNYGQYVNMDNSLCMKKILD